jgi:hypothetical protein
MNVINGYTSRAPARDMRHAEGNDVHIPQNLLKRPADEES